MTPTKKTCAAQQFKTNQEKYSQIYVTDKVGKLYYCITKKEQIAN